MATTVNGAFKEFMSDSVNLAPTQTNIARTSRDNLIENIKGFSTYEDFFTIYNDKCLRFGSFERHTKLRPLDDIDLMICISADGREYSSESNGTFNIIPNNWDEKNDLLDIYGNTLNSTKVINRYIAKLKSLNDYRKAEFHKNKEVARLQLKSYDWNFDIVPCFYTVDDFYLIPDGYGKWKKTDPRVDNLRATQINQKHNGNLLALIRLIKYWNKRRITYTISSYLLECMILNLYENKTASDNWWIDLEFRDTLQYLVSAICNAVNDPKGIQGDLNTFSVSERKKISESLNDIYQKSLIAISYEINDHNQKKAINKWREIFGFEFPEYTGV